MDPWDRSQDGMVWHCYYNSYFVSRGFIFAEARHGGGGGGGRWIRINFAHDHEHIYICSYITYIPFRPNNNNNNDTTGAIRMGFKRLDHHNEYVFERTPQCNAPWKTDVGKLKCLYGFVDEKPRVKTFSRFFPRTVCTAGIRLSDGGACSRTVVILLWLECTAIRAPS